MTLLKKQYRKDQPDQQKAKSSQFESASKFDQTLVRLATQDIPQSENIFEAAKAITESAAQLIAVERVSIWLLNTDHSQLVCIDLYERSKEKHSIGQVLGTSHYPTYFRALNSNRFINAPDAINDLRTKEFSEEFLQPLNIKSMLDAIIRQAGEMIGMISFSHVGDDIRTWKSEEIIFACNLADQTALVNLNFKRKLAQQSYQKSAARYRAILDNIVDGYYEVDLAGNFTYFNPAFEQILGYHKAAMLNMNYRQFMHPETARTVYQTFNRVYQIGKTEQAFDWELIRKDGSFRTVESSVSLIKDSYGNIQGFRGIVRDVTERKHAESEIRQRNEDLSLINEINTAANLGVSLNELFQIIDQQVKKTFNTIGVGIYFLSDDKEYLELQTQIFPDDVIKKIESLARISTPKLRISAKSSQYYQQMIAEGVLAVRDPKIIQDYICDYIESAPIHEKLKAPVRLLVPQIQKLLKVKTFIATPLISEGQPLGMLSLSFDRDFNDEDVRRLKLLDGQVSAIIQRKRAEEQIHLQSSALDAAANAIMITDKDGIIQSINHAFTQLTGYTVEETLGQNSRLLKSNLQDTSFYEQLWDTILAGKIWHGELINKRKDGSLYIDEMTITPLSDEHGHIKRFIAIKQDVSQRKLSQDILQARLRLAEYAMNHTLEEVMQKTLDEICDVANSPIGFYHFVEPDQKTISLQAWSTRTMQEFCTAQAQDNHYPIDQAGVWTDAIHQRKAIIHNDYNSLPHRKGFPNGHAQVIRELVIPILRDNKIVAVIGVGNKPFDYTKQDIDLVTYLSDIVWELTDKKRNEEKMNQQLDELRRWYDNTLDREDRIVELKREINQLLLQLNQPPRYHSVE
jgi:PAS domain S-box-containing protein